MLSRLSAVSSNAGTRDLLLIGDPVQAEREFEALPNASAEMQRIEQHFSPDGQTVLGQSRAVPAAYAMSGPDQFRWAFLRAGAHNVIAALWQADDAATPLLMDRLYGELEAGKTPDEALRTAKLSLIHSPSVYRKPFYWGAFQLYAGS
jgi:CHAT domain-containing protein